MWKVLIEGLYVHVTTDHEEHSIGRARPPKENSQSGKNLGRALIIHRDQHFVKGTRVAVERQVSAMGADVYEVGLFKPRVPRDSSNEPEMPPRVWDRETLLRSVSWLSYQNANGRNIYVRPKGEHHLSLVDDVTATAVQKMKNEGFTPALVVETSPGNFLAWLNHG